MAIRHPYIDRAKGLAIVLVVIGHVVANEPPPGAEWYSTLKHWIYIFHMPLFVFLSGLTFGFSLRVPTGVVDYFQTLRQRTSRLMTAYFVIGVLIFFGKLVFQQFTAVDNPVHGVDSLLDLALRPMLSFSRFLWYVYALSLLYAALPLLFKLSGKRLWPLVIVAALLPLLPTSNWLAWHKIQELAFFFVLGIAAGRHHPQFERLLQRAWALSLLVFLLMLPWVPNDSVWAAFCCIFAIVGLAGLLRTSWGDHLTALQQIGAFTLSIYLFNTIVIGLVKTAWVATLGWEGARFVPAFFALALAGVIVPIAMKRLLFSRVPALDRIT